MPDAGTVLDPSYTMAHYADDDDNGGYISNQWNLNNNSHNHNRHEL